MFHLQVWMRRVKTLRGEPVAGQLESSSTRWTTWMESSTSTAWTVRPSLILIGRRSTNSRFGHSCRKLVWKASWGEVRPLWDMTEHDPRQTQITWDQRIPEAGNQFDFLHDQWIKIWSRCNSDLGAKWLMITWRLKPTSGDQKGRTGPSILQMH